MKALLMHRDRDFDLRQPLPANHEALVQDLGLSVLFEAMAGGDEFLWNVASVAVLCGATDTEAIAHRQQVLRDCLDQEATVRELYEVAIDAIARERKVFGFFTRSPDAVLYRSLQVLQLLVDTLRRLRRIADEHATDFRSEGFVNLFAMVARELDDEFFLTVENHLKELRFPRGVHISARLGKGNKGTGYVLRSPPRQSWRERISSRDRSAYTFRIAERDEAGAHALSDLKSRGVSLVANAVAQSMDHIVSFFQMLRTELGFYVGCLNLHARLREKGEPVCFPTPALGPAPALEARGLYDVCLSLGQADRVVGNAVSANGTSLVMITGANQGGKSTFLRSVGLAHLMMQSGMFVAAESFCANVASGLFTHFKREEDATMTRGKLDDELARMSKIADDVEPGAVLLCNESFAATNEREGSEIARQITRALVDMGIKVFFVTHMFDLAQGFYRERRADTLFLRAERRSDGSRTFRLVEAEPLPTSHGQDVYQRIFGA